LKKIELILSTKNNIVVTNSKIYLILLLFVFSFSIVVNLLNIDTMQNSADRYGNELVHNSTIWSVDNPWYVTQIKNYLNGDGFTINPEDPIMSMRRTPGYPLFYGAHYALFGEEIAHKIIPYTQSIIFALSAVAFGIAVSLITNNAIMGYIMTLVYGTSLFFVGYLFYTVTESLHPELVVFSLFYATKFFYSKERYSSKYVVLAAVFCAMATFTRPVDGVLLIALILSILVSKRLDFPKRLQSIFIVFSIFVVISTPWIIHNYNKIGEFVFLEKYYQSGSFGGFGAKHEALSGWLKSWGHAPPANGLSLHNKISSDLDTDNRYSTIENFVDKVVPKYAYVGYSKDELFSALVMYQDCISIRLKKYDGRTNLKKGREMWGRSIQPIDLMKTKWGEQPLECESKVSSKFYNFEEKIKHGDPFRYYILAPIFVRAPQYVFHSYTQSMAFLNPKDKEFNNMQYIVKSFYYIVNVMLWFFSVVYLFLKRAWFEKLFLGSFFIISFIFLIYFIHVETRYMLAVYPFMYLMSAITLKTLWEHSKKIWR
jgi:hypothetical protein